MIFIVIFSIFILLMQIAQMEIFKYVSSYNLILSKDQLYAICSFLSTHETEVNQYSTGISLSFFEIENVLIENYIKDDIETLSNELNKLKNDEPKYAHLNSVELIVNQLLQKQFIELQQFYPNLKSLEINGNKIPFYVIRYYSNNNQFIIAEQNKYAYTYRNKNNLEFFSPNFSAKVWGYII